MSEIGPRELNRATLDRQLLLDRHDLPVPVAVERIMAVQAQEPAAAYVALWNRIRDLDFAAVDHAFTARQVLRASMMRITLHAVSAVDHPAFHTACEPILRAARLNDRRYTETGLTADDADRVLDDLLDFLGEPRTKDEVVDHLGSLDGGSAEPRLWWAMRTYAPLVHVAEGPPWSFRRPLRYEAAPDHGPRPGLDAALEVLVRRYIAAFGPASVADIAQFTMQRVPVIRAAVARIRDDLVTLRGPDGAELLDIADGPPIPATSVTAPLRLMAMWDSALLAHRDRSRILPDAARPHVIRRNGDVLPTVLVDGIVTGVWRIADDGVQVSAFRALTSGDHDELEREARALVAVVDGRHPLPFRRYDNWWPKLPSDNIEVQVDVR